MTIEEMKSMVEPYKPLYTVKETSEVLKVNKGIVYNLVRSGELPHLVLGSIKIRGTDLERFIQSYPIGGGDTDA